MSHTTKSTRRNPALTFFKSFKPSSESVPTSPTYFGSRLFRGKSPNSNSQTGHLTALRDLNSLKSNPNFHSLPYSELCKLITLEDKSSKGGATPKIKLEKSSTAMFSASKDYSSLSPGHVREELTKRKNKHSLPSEKRLILIDQYISQTEAVHTRGSFSTLKNVWHQTLSNPAKQYNRSLKNSFNGTKKNFFSMMKELNGSTVVVENFTDRLPEKKVTEISSANDFENMGRDRVYTSMDDVIEDSYNVTTQQMETLANSLKDFHKILSHTQESYKKAQEQQNNLSVFVSTFIKEVEQTEKNSKMLNVGKLNVCITSLESKIEELTSEKDLISEQLEQIYDLINIQSAKKEAMLYSPPTSLPKSPHLDIDFSNSPNNRQQSASIGNSPVSTQVKPRGSISHIKSKTNEIKDEVKKLQSERLEHQTSVRVSNGKLVRAKTREGSGQKIGESPKGDLFYKLPKDMSPQEKQEAPKDLFLILGPDSRTDLNFNLDGDESDTRRDKGNKYTRRVRLSINGNSDNPLKELAGPLYSLYRKTLGQLEEKLKEKLGKMRVFQKDVDEENSSDIELLTQQIRECFEQFVDDFKGLTKDVDSQVTSFLVNIAQNYEKFFGLANSNLLKVTSVKNIVLSSVDKLKKLEKLAGRYTQLELTDKMVRKEYDTEHRGLKQELQSDKKTLMFLIEQLDHSISTYQINPVQNPSSQEALRLVEQSKMLVRVLYNLEKFPLLEEEFNEKTTTAYMKCKTTGELIIWLKEFRNTGEIISAEKYKEADETMKTLESLHIRVVALQNEMSMISKLDILRELAAKPLLIVTKLVKKMSGIQKELKEHMDSIKQDLISHYNELISQADDIYAKLDSNIKRIANNNEHLNFFVWKQNHTLIGILKEETVKLKVEIGKYTVEKYPSSVALIPHPVGKKQQLESLEKVSECLLSTLITGDLFESWNNYQTFSGFKSNTLKEKLCDAYLKIQEELVEKEKAKANLGRESEVMKKLISDVIRVLTQLKFVIGSSFELEDRVNKEYQDFEEEHLAKDLYLLNANALFENPIVKRYPKLMSAKTLERFDTFDFKTGNTSIVISSGGSSPVSPLRAAERSFKRQVTSGPVRTLPALENPESEYPRQMQGFVERMKWVFEDFYEHNVVEYTTQHNVFKEIYETFKKMGTEEIALLEQVQRAVYNVQVNHMFYNSEIRPLTNVPKYLYVLNNWSNKVGNLTIIRESMKSCLAAIAGLEGEATMRGGIELQILKYKQIQSMVSNSVNIVIDLLSLGTQLNEKTIATLMGHSLRIEEGGLKEYVKVLDRRLKHLYNTYQINSELIEEDTRSLLENLQEFLEKLVKILHLAESKYSNIFKIISDGLRPHEGILAGYVEELYNEMKGFADEFCDGLNEIAKLALKPTWLIKVLDVFYQDIVLKDLSVFSRLSEDGKKITMFIREFKEEFVNREIKELAKYKKIHESDPTHCDKYMEKCHFLSKALNDFLTTEEILCRPELKNTLLQKLKEVQAIKKVLSVFGMVYSMGRKLNDNFLAITEQKTIPETFEKVVKLDGTLADIMNHLFRELEGAKMLDKDCTSLALGINLEVILKTDILVFYSQTKKCMNNLNEYLSGIAEFYQELKKKYKNQVLLLRDDWVDFIRDWVSTHFVTLGRKVNSIEADYPEFKERLQVFLKDLEARIKNSKYVFIETMKRVEYLNEYFFNEWFFNFSEEEKDVADKLLPRMKKLIKNIRQPKYKTATKLRQKLKKKSDLVERCDRCIKELANKNFIGSVFDGIKGWNVVAEYHGRKNIGAWRHVIEFAMNELVAPEPGQQPKQSLKEKPETIEALYAIAEKQIECSLTEVQKDFLESIYSLPLEGN